MRTIKGPGIFLAQFMGDQPPFNNLASICAWAASLGYKAVQMVRGMAFIEHVIASGRSEQKWVDFTI